MTRTAHYFAELDRAYRAMPATACVILENLARRYGLTAAEVNIDIRARFGHDFH